MSKRKAKGLLGPATNPDGLVNKEGQWGEPFLKVAEGKSKRWGKKKAVA